MSGVNAVERVCALWSRRCPQTTCRSAPRTLRPLAPALTPGRELIRREGRKTYWYIPDALGQKRSPSLTYSTSAYYARARAQQAAPRSEAADVPRRSAQVCEKWFFFVFSILQASYDPGRTNVNTDQWNGRKGCEGRCRAQETRLQVIRALDEAAVSCRWSRTRPRRGG